MSQNALDELVGVPIGRTYSYEKARAMPPEGYLKKVARILDCSFDQLRYGTEPEAPQGLAPGFDPPGREAGHGAQPKVGRRLFPLVGSAGAAAFPLQSAEYSFEDYIPFDDDLYVDGAVQFVIQIRGRSMEPRLHDKSYCLITKDEGFRLPGYLVAVEIDGEYVTKVLDLKDGEYILRAVNPDYPTLRLGEDARMVGKIIGNRQERGRRSYIEEGDVAGLTEN